jgi:hypothetical protein
LHHYVLLTLAGSAYELLAAHVQGGPLGQAATGVAKRLYQKRTGFSVPDSGEPLPFVQPQDRSMRVPCFPIYGISGEVQTLPESACREGSQD